MRDHMHVKTSLSEDKRIYIITITSDEALRAGQLLMGVQQVLYILAGLTEDGAEPRRVARTSH